MNFEDPSNMNNAFLNSQCLASTLVGWLQLAREAFVQNKNYRKYEQHVTLSHLGYII